jgi:hypothetical protein
MAPADCVAPANAIAWPLQPEGPTSRPLRGEDERRGLESFRLSSARGLFPHLLYYLLLT